MVFFNTVWFLVTILSLKHYTRFEAFFSCLNPIFTLFPSVFFLKFHSWKGWGYRLFLQTVIGFAVFWGAYHLCLGSFFHNTVIEIFGLSSAVFSAITAFRLLNIDDILAGKYY